MKINVLGGGPAGLYFALLMKRRNPQDQITVFERNPRDNTFGWGVVFSDKTLEYLEGPDPTSYQTLSRRLKKWKNVDIVHQGELVSVGGNRFSGVARIELLKVLQERCEELGVVLQFGTEVSDLTELEDADLVVGADGINSLTRTTYADVFRPSLDHRPNKYIWYGTPQLFHGLTLTFRSNADGLFIAHSYKFSDDLSTFIVECDPESWRRAGLDQTTDTESRAYLEEVFAPDLAGHPLLSNKSTWIQFITVRNASWVHGHRVLLGDAAHTAHFSIGSGTKLALEDAIALADQFALAQENGVSDVGATLVAYETTRRPVVEKLQRAAQSSLEWFESAQADLHLPPLPFALRAMTRSDRIDLANLRRRDPEFVRAVEPYVKDGRIEAAP